MQKHEEEIRNHIRVWNWRIN